MEKIILCVESCCNAVPVPSNGVPVPFESGHFEGSICFVHHVPGDRSNSTFSERPEKSDCQWEIQIQGRFKTIPHGRLRCGGQLPDMPYGLGHVFRSLCGKAFQGLMVENCHHNDSIVLSQPLIQNGRLCRSFDPISLPIIHPEAEGTWQWFGEECCGAWWPTDWRAQRFDDYHYYAFAFNSPYIDWSNWKATNIPGLRSLGFERFWGHQSCSVKMYDDKHCFLELQFLPPAIREARSIAHCKSRMFHDVSTSSLPTQTSLSNYSSEMEFECTSSCLEVDGEDEDSGPTDDIPDERNWNGGASCIMRVSL